MTIFAHTEPDPTAKATGSLRPRLVIHNSDGTRLGALVCRRTGIGRGWRFYPAYQAKPSRKGWSTERQALKSYGIKLTDHLPYALYEYQRILRRIGTLAVKELRIAGGVTTDADGVWIEPMYDDEYRQMADLVKEREKMRAKLTRDGWIPKSWESERLRGLKEARERSKA